jgi:hypothetical protein
MDSETIRLYTGQDTARPQAYSSSWVVNKHETLSAVSFDDLGVLLGLDVIFEGMYFTVICNNKNYRLFDDMSPLVDLKKRLDTIKEQRGAAVAV